MQSERKLGKKEKHMKIQTLKINQFGKLQNKEIELDNHINLIIGKNESGKSTLLKFILSMFYGLSKNKNGKTYTDFEKYTPWQENDFSGKIKYTLENGQTYEVFREFRKKSPHIYNDQFEEVSQNYTIDKTTGSRFFTEQTGIEEDLFTKTIVSMQNETRLEEKEQTSLVQNLSNLVSTGEDTLSYQKIIAKLNKKQLEEIGTARSQDRPINIISKRLTQIETEKENLSRFVEKKYDFEENKKILEEEIKQEQIKLDLLKKRKTIEDNNYLQQEKIRIGENTIKEYQSKIEQLKKVDQSTITKNQSKIEKVEQNKTTDNIENGNQKEDKKEQNNKKNGNTPRRMKEETNKKIGIIPIIASILFVSLTVFGIMRKISLFTGVGVILTFFSLILLIYQQYRKKSGNHTTNFEENVDNEKVNTQINLLQETLENLQKEQETLKASAKRDYDNSLEEIKNEFMGKLPLTEIHNLLTTPQINENIEVLENKIAGDRLKIQSIALDQNNILPKLENLANLEEEYESLEEQYQALSLQSEATQLAKQEIENAYREMKKQVTPNFTQHLSSIMENISNGTYTNIQLDEKDGIIVETKNGNYIPVDYLSIGTIDQLYLSLRLGAENQITKEELPIMLDETFAYYDDERLENILNFLHTEYKNRQIIIFTCTNREKEICEKKNIPYHTIEIER